MSKPYQPKPKPSPKPISSITSKSDDASGLDSRELVSVKTAYSRSTAAAPSLKATRPGTSKKHSPSRPARASLVFANILWTRWRRYRTCLRHCRKEFSMEALHQLRVATRRLRTFVRLLEPLTEHVPERKACRLLKRRLKALGKLRDVQVQRMEILSGQKRFPGLAGASERLGRREKRLAAAVLDKICSFKNRKLQQNLQAVRAELEGTSLNDTELLSRVWQSAQEAFNEVVSRRRTIDPRDAPTIHRTRVAFKKFRYIVEGLSPSFTGLTRAQLGPMSDFQTSMGLIQDLEITESWLQEFVQEHPEEAAGVRPFLTHLRRRKLALQRAFVCSADRLFEFWPIPNLEAQIQGRPVQPVLRFAVHESGSVKFLGAKTNGAASSGQTASSSAS